MGDRKEQKCGYQPKVQVLSPSVFSPADSLTLNLFNFSDAVSTESPASEKPRLKSAKRQNPYLYLPEKRTRYSKFGTTLDIKKNGRKAGEPWSPSDSSDGDRIDIESMIGNGNCLSPHINSVRTVQDTEFEDDNQIYLSHNSSDVNYLPSSRSFWIRKIASESHVHDCGILKERITRVKNRVQWQFSDGSPSTPASFMANSIDSFNLEFNHLEARVRNVRDYINETREEISTLKTNPSNFDEIRGIIGLSRMKQIKEKLTEVKNLIRWWEAVEITNGLDSNFDHARDLMTIAKNCVVELKKLEKDSLNKIDMFAVQFWNNLPNIQNDYWKKSQKLRRGLEQIQLKHRCKNNLRNQTIEKLQIEYKEMKSDNAIIKMLKNCVEELREFGDFLGRTGKPETLECRNDSMDLAMLHNSIFKQNEEMTNALKSEYLKKERMVWKRARKNSGSPAGYLGVVDWC